MARPDESLQQAPHLSLAQHADELVAISTYRICVYLREKWPWKSGNGSFPGLFAFSACQLEMIFSSLVEIKECAISNVQLVHPLRGTAFAGRRRPVQAVGAFRPAAALSGRHPAKLLHWP